MKFILNFFLFGFLFYLIYLFFPEAFQTLVMWATKVYEFFAGLYQMLMEKTRGLGTKPAQPEEVQQAMVYLQRLL